MPSAVAPYVNIVQADKKNKGDYKEMTFCTERQEKQRKKNMNCSSIPRLQVWIKGFS